MAQKRASRKPAGGRGSAEAIEKRRTARQLNAILSGSTNGGQKLDGRTEKRRRRLIKELKEGKGGKELKPIDVVAHVNELITIGESIASLKKQGVKPRKTEQTPEVIGVARRAQEAYDFHPDAWKMLGIPIEEPPASKKPRRARRRTK